jgi:hypothetical protein
MDKVDPTYATKFTNKDPKWEEHSSLVKSSKLFPPSHNLQTTTRSPSERFHEVFDEIWYESANWTVA